MMGVLLSKARKTMKHMKRWTSCSVGILLAGAVIGMAQSSATYDEAAKVFRLDGGNVTYAFGVNARGELQQLYWGGRLSPTDRIGAAVPAYATALGAFMTQPKIVSSNPNAAIDSASH